MKQNKLWMLVIMMIALLVTACESEDQKAQKAKADKLIEKAYKARNYNQILALADSLEQAGSMSQTKAYYWLGYASDRLKKIRMAEFYWKASIEEGNNSTDPEDLDAYAKSASRLANLLSVRGDYESALKATIPVANRLEELQCDSTSDYINLLIYIGCCQAGLGLSGETTADGFNRAYNRHVENVEKNHTEVAYKDAIAGLINMSYACITIKDYQHAMKWIERFGQLLNEFQQRPDASFDYIDKQLARYDIYQAQALQGLGRNEEAAKAFDSFQTTEYSKTPEGRIAANEYLMAAQRWDEAADNYGSLDALIGKEKVSLEDIENLLLRKYKVNVTAGRRDSAIAVSLQICNKLEPAFKQANLLDKEEQATIVANVEKMTEQQAELQRKNRMYWNGLLGVLLLCFIGYVVYRRIASKRLEAAHQKLMDSFHDIEQESATKERKATEMRIASSVQGFVIPSELPRYKGLQVFLSKQTGAMEGGGYFDCLLRDEKFTFCIGDASGKSAQRSILSAMITLQFRMVSAYETDPGRIVTAINTAVTREKDASNFVRLFVGTLDLKTGMLTYCNANHNAPLLLDGETPVKLPVDENPPVATQPGIVYQAQGIQTDPDMTIFFYTDGLARTVNGSNKRYGEKRMLGTALQAMKIDPKPQPFVENMLEDIRRYAGDTERDGDMLMFAFRFKK